MNAKARLAVQDSDKIACQKRPGGDRIGSSADPREGETWEKSGKRGGKLIFSETITEYRDQNGELVVTARGVGVRTEKIIEQK